MRTTLHTTTLTLVSLKKNTICGNAIKHNSITGSFGCELSSDKLE